MITSWSLAFCQSIPLTFFVPPGVCNRILLWFQPVNPGCVLLHLGVCRWGSILPSNLQFFELAAQSRKYKAQRLVQNIPPLPSANEPNQWTVKRQHFMRQLKIVQQSSSSMNGSSKWVQNGLSVCRISNMWRFFLRFTVLPNVQPFSMWSYTRWLLWNSCANGSSVPSQLSVHYWVSNWPPNLPRAVTFERNLGQNPS